jgi:hypothetical protein
MMSFQGFRRNGPFFFCGRLYPYPLRKFETCPRANEVCLKANRSEVFGFNFADIEAARLHAA